MKSENALGNMSSDTIHDIVFVDRATFDRRYTVAIAEQVGQLNQKLKDSERSYLLIGPGRWGTSERWLGVPTNWSQISNAKVIVETTLPDMNIEPSQGAHFFHNISSFQVSYFTDHHDSDTGIDWQWLDEQCVVSETELVRHVRLERPLEVRVDGRTGRGIIRHG